MTMALTDAATRELTDYFRTHCTGPAVAAHYLREAAAGGEDPFAGCVVEIAARHSVSGNPNPVHIPPSWYVWNEASA